MSDVPDQTCSPCATCVDNGRMSDVPDQTCSSCATCDTMLLSDKQYYFSYDAVTDRDVTKKTREKYDHITLEAVRSAGHDSDEKNP